MYEVSFVLDNVWYTVVGDRQSVEKVKELILKHQETEDERTKHLTQMSRVGAR
jgi:hypothetical protein